MNTRSSKLRALSFALSLVLCLGLGIRAYAQTTQQFTGHVFDTAGAVIPQAEVVVHNLSSNVDTTTVTTALGAYTVPYLQPGIYTITVTKQGFEAEKKTDITLNIDQTSTIDFKLKVGTTREVVTVVADAEQIELSKADRGEIIEADRINEMPIDGRNVYELYDLSPGVEDFTNPAYPRVFDNVTDNFKANGAPQAPSLNLDGITNEAGGMPNNGFTTNSAIVPGEDTVQEYKVVTNAYDASYGKGGGAAIDVALKSGGNPFHGVLNYTKRGAWLDTYSWASKFAATPSSPATKAPHNRNQFSFEADGPVVIPHLYNGKNRLFYVASYEELLDTLPSQSPFYFSVPNPDWLTGDFSTAQYWNTALNNGNGGLAPLNIYDPLSTPTLQVDPNDGKSKLTYQQFPGNKIPSNRIDQVGQALANIEGLVKPNFNPGPGYAPWTDNYIAWQLEKDTWRNALVKVDYNLSQNNKLSFHWAAQARFSNSLSVTCLPNSDPANMNGKGAQPQSQSGGAQWTHIFSPNLIANLNATVVTQANKSHQGPAFSSNIYETLGFASAFYNQVSNTNSFPYVGMDGPPNGGPANWLGYAPMSWFGSGGSFNQHDLALLPTVTWIKGAHSIKAGIDVRFHQSSNPIGGNNDQWHFGTPFSSEFYQASDAVGYSSGSSIASMLLGYPESGTVVHNLHDFESQHDYAFYVQDDWKLTKQLTLNLGFRWDIQQPVTSRTNAFNGIFNTNVTNPASTDAVAIQGGLEFAGVNGQPAGAWKTNWLELQPRIGFAYAITTKMSIRGGVGENFQYFNGVDGQSGFATSTSYTSSCDNGEKPFTGDTTTDCAGAGLGLANPIPIVNQPVGARNGYYQNLGQGINFINPNYHIPALWSYSLTYEAALSRRDTASVSYVGNISPDLPVAYNINSPSTSFYAQCDAFRAGFSGNSADPTYLKCQNSATQVANPFLGLNGFQGSGYYGNPTVYSGDMTRPYPAFFDINEAGITNDSKSWYNSLQIEGKHDVSHSLVLHANYTHARALQSGQWLDQLNGVKATQLSQNADVRHTVKFSGVGYLPFGRGQLLLSNVNRFTDMLVSGWEISPMLSYYSGFAMRPNGNWAWNTSAPMGIKHKNTSVNGNQAIVGVDPCIGYVDQVTGAVKPYPAATAAGCSQIKWVDHSQVPYAAQLNTVDFGIRSPGAVNFDMNGSKNFKIPDGAKIGLSENTNLQLRVDILNVLNHPNWDWNDGVSSSGFDLNPSDQNWGKIVKGPSNSPTNYQRVLQLSARLNW